MGVIYFSKQPPVLCANIIVLGVQIAMYSYDLNDFMLNSIFLLFTGLIVIPMLYYSHKQVKINNYLIHNGKVVETKIHREETKIIFAAKTTVVLQVQCTLFADGAIHIFKDEYSFSMYDKKKVLKRLEDTDTVLVLTDNSCKRYKILFQSLLHELYDDTHYECPRVLNYIILIINVGCGIINLFKML